MRYFHKQQNHFWKPVINLDKVRPPLIATVN
jgi:large subunit ribosomal protein L27Ae